ncbi:hypothetical protein [Curtobacterium sp. MCSS17_016]|uniref:hypothetical protein n=1 Tax=Curtobacterium sp. MCSS17_016 TaxID=2175644 RepID=UPI000DA7818F|nr:hypothetical protein [Curtobacterium sp. MCSS17_016]WIE81060.1 hypothetical protein DEJ19_021320 [Curtobacterium sp. MCSS17_016]
MSAAQLIYFTHDPRALTWAEHAAGHAADVQEAWNTFVAEAAAAFPAADGQPRGVAAVSNAIVGLRRSTADEHIVGWDYAPAIDALVPDNSPAGHPWQKRIDALPVAEPPTPLHDVGMADNVIVQHDDANAVIYVPDVHIDTDERITFALWPDRGVKTALDELIERLSTATGVRWHEMPRSTWYARVEAAEARAAA